MLIREHERRPPQGQPFPPLRIAVYFDVPQDFTDLTRRLHSGTSAVRASAQGELDASIAKRAAELRPALAAVGVTNLTSGVGIPALFGNAGREAIAAASRLAGIVFVQGDEPGEPRPLAEAPLDITSDPHIDTAFNAHSPPLFGLGHAVGVYEARSPGCSFYQGHRTFQFATIVDSKDPITCSIDTECDRCNEGGLITPASRNTFCLDFGGGKGKRCAQRHLTQTLSAVSASVGTNSADPPTPYSAAKATLLNFNDTGGNCSDERFDAAFKWYMLKGASTTFESFTCDRISGRGTTQDFYARYKNMAVSRAASNDVTESACEHVHNGLCVGASTKEGGVWRKPTSENPDAGSTFLNPFGRDREEPDVMALGAEATTAWADTFDVAKTATPRVYTGAVNGTSISTPIVAAMTVLLKEACAAPNLDQRLLRAMMMTSAWSRNADGWLYSTPGVASSGALFDHKDGAGIPVADNLIRFCGAPGAPSQNGPGIASGTALVDLLDTSRFPPNFFLNTTDRPPGGTGSGDPGTGSTPSKTKLSTNLVAARYWSARLTAGQRVRTTLSWDSCISAKYNRVSTDFDVYLCNEDPPALGAPPAAYCFYASRSFDDNNEGMDVVVDKRGLWSLWYAFPAAREIEFKGVKTKLTPTCLGSAVEPVAWAVAWF